MKGGWSAVPVSETSVVGPRADCHSIAMVVTVTSVEPVGHLISIRFNLTPDDNRESKFEPALATFWSPTESRLRRKPLVIAKPVKAEEAMNLNWCLHRTVLLNTGMWLAWASLSVRR